MSYIESHRNRFINTLKLLAKQEKKKHDNKKLSDFQLILAQHGGFNEWSQLSEYVHESAHEELCNLILKYKGLVDYEKTMPAASSMTDEEMEQFEQEMLDFVHQHFEPLVNFAPLDNESETGYAWPEVDLQQELQDNFDHRFPYADFIEHFATNLELSRGPWGDSKSYD